MEVEICFLFWEHFDVHQALTYSVQKQKRVFIYTKISTKQESKIHPERYANLLKAKNYSVSKLKTDCKTVHSANQTRKHDMVTSQRITETLITIISNS